MYQVLADISLVGMVVLVPPNYLLILESSLMELRMDLKSFLKQMNLNKMMLVVQGMTQGHAMLIF